MRIHVERVIGLLRNKFTIFQSTIPIFQWCVQHCATYVNQLCHLTKANMDEDFTNQRQVRWHFFVRNWFIRNQC